MELSIPQIALMSRLLDEALPLDSAGRRAWLRTLTPEYQDLAQALREALLPEEAQAAGLEDLSTLPKLGSLDEASSILASRLHPGTPLGPYELIRVLGVGGMAQVWLARRADGAFKREVALKLPTLTHLQADLEQRFARERDILASLEHPHIARFYDAGISPNGLPYLAMEYVQGEPLTHWCDARRLRIPARLQLFVQVLGAVQYAHEKHVIHRDLKPSNILVSESAHVQLLDFGVAKLLEAAESDQALTGVYWRAVTLDYASPELLSGGRVDARSDVYSLGVVLYELLTGVRPYRLKDTGSKGFLEKPVATVEVSKPSTQIEPDAVASRDTTHERLARQLRGDLDAIALKALAKEPTERYASAAALAEDLQRYLEIKPIQAQSTRLSYRVRKFVRRNGTVVGVTATAAAAILATLGYTLYRETVTQARVAASAATVSAPALHSVAVLPFVDLSEKKDQEYLADGVSEELIDFLSRVPDLRVPARTSSFYFKTKSVTLAEIARALNVAQLIEGSVRRTGSQVRITAQLIRADSGYHVWSQTYERDLKDIFQLQDEIAIAVVTALKAKLPGAQAANPRLTNNPEAYIQYLLGKKYTYQFTRDSLPRATEAFNRAVALDPQYAAAYAGLAWAESNLWARVGVPGSLQRAAAAADRAIALAPELAEGYAVRGSLRAIFLWTWDWDGARADFDKALALEPKNSWVLSHYGYVDAAEGRLLEAVAVARRAIEIDPLTAPPWDKLGTYLTASGNLSEARRALHRALEIDPDFGQGYYDLGVAELLANQPEQAMASVRATGDSLWRLTGLAIAEHSSGHPKESQQALDELIRTEADVAAYQIAEVYAWRGERDKAFEWLDRAYARRDPGVAMWVKWDPTLAALRADSRYAALLHLMKLPE